MPVLRRVGCRWWVLVVGLELVHQVGLVCLAWLGVLVRGLLVRFRLLVAGLLVWVIQVWGLVRGRLLLAPAVRMWGLASIL